MMLATALLLLAQSETLKVSIEATAKRFNPDGEMRLKFTIENLTEGEIAIDEPADWLDGLEIRDAKNTVVKAVGTSKETKRTQKVDGRGFIGRTVNAAATLKGKSFEEGLFKFKWCWLGRTSGEVTAAVLREYEVKVETNFGDFSLVFYADVAPNHVLHFLQLVRAGFYDKKKISRLIPSGFAIAGAGETGVSLKAEFNSTPHKFGAVAATHADDPDSANSEFYICLADLANLDGKDTVFAQVKEGADTIKSLNSVKTDHSPCACCGKNLPGGYASGHCGNHHHDAPQVDLVIKSMKVELKK